LTGKLSLTAPTRKKRFMGENLGEKKFQNWTKLEAEGGLGGWFQTGWGNNRVESKVRPKCTLEGRFIGEKPPDKVKAPRRRDREKGSRTQTIISNNCKKRERTAKLVKTREKRGEL